MHYADFKTILSPQGCFIITVTWPEDEWVYGFLLSFGKYLEVLEPVHIRDIVKDKMIKAIKKYSEE